MEEYWDKRYRSEGRIWGNVPSSTVRLAAERFRREGVKRVLIPGIGYGRNARELLAAGFRVDGVEISGEALGLLKMDLPQIWSHHGSVLDAPLDAGIYDAIYCYNVLHLFTGEDRKAFIRKCLGLLKEGGLAFFTVMSEKDAGCGKGRETEPGTFETRPGKPVHYFTDEDLRSQFNRFIILETGIAEDAENHGEEGPHLHTMRCILVQKRSIGFDGERYRDVSSHQKAWAGRVIDGLDLRGDERILDLGCGDGIISGWLADLVPEGSVLGIDASASMVAAAKKLERDNLRFRLLDIDALDFNGEFDVVFSNATLHWVKDHDRLLENVARALKKGGIARFNFGGEGNFPDFMVVIREAMARPGFSRHFTNFEWPWYMPEVAEYEARVRAHFADARVWPETADRIFTKEELIGFIEQPAILPFIRYVGEADRGAFRDFVVGRILDRTKRDDGTYFEEFRRINVQAKKR